MKTSYFIMATGIANGINIATPDVSLIKGKKLKLVNIDGIFYSTVSRANKNNVSDNTAITASLAETKLGYTKIIIDELTEFIANSSIEIKINNIDLIKTNAITAVSPIIKMFTGKEIDVNIDSVTSRLLITCLDQKTGTSYNPYYSMFFQFEDVI